jgi:hypothetical protein
MVKESWIENKISKMEAKRLENKWSKRHEEQLQYLLKVYRTGDFSTYNMKQINERIANISK